MDMVLDQAILLARRTVKDPFARTYIDACESAIAFDGKHGLAVQLMYFLSNAKYWRTEGAAEAKRVMKDYIEKVEGYKL